MSKVFIEETTLTNIGAAIREKTGKNDLIAPGDMPREIRGIVSGGGGGEDIEPIVLTGDCSYACAGTIPSKFIELYPDKVTTHNLNSGNYMFYNYMNESVPFDLNFSSNYSPLLTNMFSFAKKLKVLPKMYNINPKTTNLMFYGCESLREIPEDYFDTFNWSYITTLTSAYAGDMSGMCKNCYSLRKFPIKIFNNVNPYAAYSYTCLSGGFQSCYVLDELVDLPLKYPATYTSNVFLSSFSNCSRLKKLTFALEDGQPVKMNWKSQTLDLSTYVGYLNTEAQATMYNSGITADKKVTDDATYQALKNDEDWFTAKLEYSRYNHDSAVETINSLPDTSEYLATAGGTNTIKFKGAAGALTDGGAINTMTEEEIAVATAKGWSVSLT